ncbi:MAG: hypothetical protein ACJASV_000978 [Pseudorhodobacter sp.]|jgi:hypothetical protein
MASPVFDRPVLNHILVDMIAPVGFVAAIYRRDVSLEQANRNAKPALNKANDRSLRDGSD